MGDASFFMGRPALRILIPMLVALLFYYTCSRDLSSQYLIVAAVLCSIFTFSRPTYASYLLLACLSYLYVVSYEKIREHDLRSVENRSVIVCSATIESRTSDNVSKFKATLLIDGVRQDGNWMQSNARLLSYDESLKPYQQGDKFICQLRVTPINTPKHPGDVDYRRIFRNKRVVGYAKLHWCEQYDSSIKSPIALASNVQQKLADRINGAFNFEKASLLNALLLGFRNDLSYDVKNAFIASGTMHILCVSGLHVGIVFLVLRLIFAPLKRSAKGFFYTALLLLGIWAFAFISGLSASVCRAALMLSFWLVAKWRNREGDIWNIIAASAMIQLAWDPRLILDVGFQLSYSALSGILILYKPLTSFLPSGQFLVAPKVYKLMSVSLAAQIGTAGLALFYFDQFPTYFLFSNILMLPLGTITLYLGIAFLIVGEPLVFILDLCLSLLMDVSSYIGSLPTSVINFQIEDASFVLLYYALLICMILFMYRSSIRYLAALFAIIIIFNIYSFTQENFGTNEECILLSCKKDCSVIEYFCEGSQSSFSYTKLCSDSVACAFLKADDILILFDVNSVLNSNYESISCKLLVTGSVSLIELQDIVKRTNPQVIVSNTYLSYKEQNVFAWKCRQVGIPYYICNRNGAMKYATY